MSGKASPVLSYTDKLSMKRRDFTSSDSEFIVTFKGASRSFLEAFDDLLHFDFAHPADVIKQIQTNSKMQLSGKNLNHGFARIRVNDNDNLDFLESQLATLPSLAAPKLAETIEELKKLNDNKIVNEMLDGLKGASAPGLTDGITALRQTIAEQKSKNAKVVAGQFDEMQKSRDILHYVPGLSTVDQNGCKYNAYAIPEFFTIQLTGEYLAKEKSQFLLHDQEKKFLKDYNLGERVFKNWTPGYFVLRLPEGRSNLTGIGETIDSFRDDDNVLFAEPLFAGFGEALIHPDEGVYNSSPCPVWGLKYYGSNGCRVVLPTGTADAWNNAKMGAGGSNGIPQVKIVVIDTGIQNDHPDLGTTEGGTYCIEDRTQYDSPPYSKGYSDWDFSNDANAVPNDSDGHGTNVAGVAAADSPNGADTVGVAPGCKVIPLKIDLGTDDGGLYSQRADAINYVGLNCSFTDKWGKTRGKGIALCQPSYRYVVNLSWWMSADAAAVRNAIANATDTNKNPANNVLFFAAVGDSGINISTNPVYPACYPKVIPVGGVDSSGTKQSNFGNANQLVIFAPNDHDTTVLTSTGRPYDVVRGSSIACGFASGVAALIWTADWIHNGGSTHFTKTATDIKNIITNAANTDPANVTPYGIGRINAYKCINAV